MKSTEEEVKEILGLGEAHLTEAARQLIELVEAHGRKMWEAGYQAGYDAAYVDHKEGW